MSSVAFRFPALQPYDPGSLGGFRLVARLGEGGMGQAFLALSPGGHPAAVKVIRHEFASDVEFGQRFAREVGAAQKVRGAHIAALLDAAPRAEQPWLAMTYVAGPSLRDLVIGHGPLPAAQVTLLAWGIAHALADIHTAKVVHRDLKPGNIMLDESGPKVIDFGIVKSLTQSVTYSSHSTRIGTPLYMSPEQATGHAVGAASDVFALGSTLYFLATGCEAFAAENQWAVAHRVIADDPDVSVLPPLLRRLITACLHKDPDQRPTPLVVQQWCEEELGDALGPGAWMGITGARAAIQQRTSALHVLTAPGPVAVGSAVRDQPEFPRAPESGQTILDDRIREAARKQLLTEAATAMRVLHNRRTAVLADVFSRQLALVSGPLAKNPDDRPPARPKAAKRGNAVGPTSHPAVAQLLTTAPVTVARSRWSVIESLARFWGQAGGWPLGILGVIVGAANPGKAFIPFFGVHVPNSASRGGTALLGGLSGAIWGMLVLGAVGVVLGFFRPLDQIVVDSEGLHIRPASRPPLDIPWTTVSEVSVGWTSEKEPHMALQLRFLAEHAPTDAWRRLYDVHQDQSGRFIVYEKPKTEPGRVDPLKLREPLHVFAGDRWRGVLRPDGTRID